MMCQVNVVSSTDIGTTVDFCTMIRKRIMSFEAISISTPLIINFQWFNINFTDYAGLFHFQRPIDITFENEKIYRVPFLPDRVHAFRISSEFL